MALGGVGVFHQSHALLCRHWQGLCCAIVRCFGHRATYAGAGIGLPFFQIVPALLKALVSLHCFRQFWENTEMARITDASDDWSATVSLSQDEIWQARGGSFFLTTTPSPEPDDGVLLPEGSGILLSAGRNVRYRRAGPVMDTVIIREGV